MEVSELRKKLKVLAAQEGPNCPVFFIDRNDHTRSIIEVGVVNYYGYPPLILIKETH